MPEEKDDQSPLAKLNHKLSLIDNLMQKLSGAQQDSHSLVLLARNAHDMMQMARGHADDEVLKLILKVSELASASLASRRLQETERARLFSLLGQLHRKLRDDSGILSKNEIRTESSVKLAPTEVLVVSAHERNALLSRLKGAGFPVSHLTEPGAAESALAKVMPLAVVIDVAFPGGSRAGVELIARLREQVFFTAPVFFVGPSSDLEARLAAVEAGGAGYFVDPPDAKALLEKLSKQLFSGSAPGGYRVLMIDQSPLQGSQIAALLENKGIASVKSVTQAQGALETLQQFKPDLVILDLDLEGIDGMQLAKALRQHQACDDKPLILFSRRTDLEQQLAALEVERAELLSKPLAKEYLCEVVKFRLRRSGALQTQLSTLLNQDPVSGLYNRRYFLAALERALGAADSESSGTAVMFILFDNLLEIRKATDVTVSDEVVTQAGNRLRNAFGSDQLTARFGDGMFAILAPDSNSESLHASAQRVRDVLESQPYQVGEHSVGLHTCIGIAMAGEGEQNAHSLVQQADLACSLARQKAGDCIHVHQTQTDQRNQEAHEQELLKAIREAVGKGYMTLVFQPVVSLQGDQEERYEVFLRMRTSEGRELLPESVFNVVQKHRLGLALDRWIISQSLQVLQERQLQAPSTTLFINVSLATLQDDALPVWLRERLEMVRVNVAGVVFEVAEPVIDGCSAELSRFVETIKSLGCRFSLQRFTGAADSMELARKLLVDYVKFDLFYVQGLVKNEAGRQQLLDLVNGLKSHDTRAIVCGVEDLRTLPVLWSCGINLVQGFFLQPPHEEMNYDFKDTVI